MKEGSIRGGKKKFDERRSCRGDADRTSLTNRTPEVLEGKVGNSSMEKTENRRIGGPRFHLRGQEISEESVLALKGD